MSSGSRIRDLLLLALAPLILLLAACSSAPETGSKTKVTEEPAVGGPGGTSPGSGTVAVSKLVREDEMVTLCQGREVEGWEFFAGYEAELCNALVLGLAEAAASMGRYKSDSRFCVASDFRFDAYRQEFLGAMNDDSLAEDVAEERVLKDIAPADREDCSWPGQRSLKGLADDCRWFTLARDDISGAIVTQMMLRSGARTEAEFKDVFTGSIARCGGYIGGFLAAAIISEELETKPAYCVGEDVFGTEDEDSADLAVMIDMAEALVVTAYSGSWSANEPASGHMYSSVVKQFPCPAARPET